MAATKPRKVRYEIVRDIETKIVGIATANYCTSVIISKSARGVPSGATIKKHRPDWPYCPSGRSRIL
jgi:hypothetical protein